MGGKRTSKTSIYKITICNLGCKWTDIVSKERKGDGKREPDVAVNQRITKSKETERKEREYLPVYRREGNSFGRSINRRVNVPG